MYIYILISGHNNYCMYTQQFVWVYIFVDGWQKWIREKNVHDWKPVYIQKGMASGKC